MPQRYDTQSEDSDNIEPADNGAVYGPSVLIAALDQIEILLEDARTVPLSPNVIINKAGIIDLVGQAREALPEDLVAADAVVADADAVLDRADAAAEVAVAEASAKARALLDDTRDKVDVMLREATEEADRKVTKAQEEASQIRSRTQDDVAEMIAAAKEQAARLVAAETVLRTAQEQAKEILYQARTQASDLKLGADDYAATALAQVSQVLNDLLRRTESGRRTIAERSGFDHKD